MYIKHDYSLVNKRLIEKGYGQLSVHSLHFDRHFNEQEKEANRKASEELTREQWNERCDQISKYISIQLHKVLRTIKDKYNIHQLTEETSTMEHYKSNWDLFFYSNKGWNKKEYFDYFTLTFNDKRSVEDNNRLLVELLSIFEVLDIKNVSCRVQYTAIRNEEKIQQDGLKLCERLVGQFIEYSNCVGKIKLVGDNQYGFFKKGASKRYYPVSYEYAVLNLQ